MVGTAGFEPAITCPPDKWHTRLAHVPKIWSEWRDLNPRQLAPKASGLPDCPTLRKSSCGAHNRNRTDDLHLTKMALFHLSYAGMEPSEGLEPPTWNLQGSRSAN